MTLLTKNFDPERQVLQVLIRDEDEEPMLQELELEAILFYFLACKAALQELGLRFGDEEVQVILPN